MFLKRKTLMFMKDKLYFIHQLFVVFGFLCYDVFELPKIYFKLQLIIM